MNSFFAVKRIFKLLVVTALLITWSSSNAAPGFYNADVLIVGNYDIETSPGSGVRKKITMVFLTAHTGEFTDRWFVLSPVIEKEAQATALSAIALGKHVLIQTDLVGTPVYGPYVQITGFFLPQ